MDIVKQFLNTLGMLNRCVRPQDSLGDFHALNIPLNFLARKTRWRQTQF